jgi:hypothetical protein
MAASQIQKMLGVTLRAGNTQVIFAFHISHSHQECVSISECGAICQSSAVLHPFLEYCPSPRHSAREFVGYVRALVGKDLGMPGCTPLHPLILTLFAKACLLTVEELLKSFQLQQVP